ncbi:MAG: hypothetical protein U0L20_09695 [Ruminococcus sp.]|nr:hypothetical protein [Ruminococcus sp.]
MYETRGEAKYYYSYDPNGILYNVKYTLTDDSEMKSYFYTHNSRGDIVGIYSGSGVLTAQYEYDVWGNILSITDGSGNAITDPNNVGNLNPFRYRGYYYDSDTGLYYLMSFGVKLNLSELKVGFEGSTAIQWDNTTETAYTNASINGWTIAAVYILVTTGQYVQSLSYVY